MRITLKEIETLTYSCSSTLDLIDLEKQLKSLRTELQSKLPQEEGIIIRPAVVARALKTKKKYAQLRQKKQNCSALTLSKKRGKRRADSKYRNKVGARADRLQKVNVYHHRVKSLTDNFAGSLSNSKYCRHYHTEVNTLFIVSDVLFKTILRSDQQADEASTAGRKRKRCGKCTGCTYEDDCGVSVL